MTALIRFCLQGALAFKLSSRTRNDDHNDAEQICDVVGAFLVLGCRPRLDLLDSASMVTQWCSSAACLGSARVRECG